MKNLALFCITFLGLSLASAKDELRNWTNASGKTISAQLTGLEGDDATLKMTNGRTYTVSLSTLSPEDGEYARKWQKQQEIAASMSEVDTKLGIPTEAIVETPFDQDTPRTRKGMVAGWQAGIGEWRIEEGMLIGDELPEDSHHSSLTHRLEATHLIITAQIQLGEAQQIAFACRDTVPPNLHLARLYITPEKIWIQHMTGIAKTTTAEKLIVKDVRLKPDEWYDVTIEIIGDQYRAKVGKEDIEATHSRFADAKGIVALTNKGKGAKYRNVALWNAKPK